MRACSEGEGIAEGVVLSSASPPLEILLPLLLILGININLRVLVTFACHLNIFSSLMKQLIPIRVNLHFERPQLLHMFLL